MFKRFFGKREEQPENTALSDHEYQGLFFRLLEGVSEGWDLERVQQHLGSRSQDRHMLAWLRRFGKRQLSVPQPNHDLANLLIKFGELKSGLLSQLSLQIGQELMSKPVPPSPQQNTV
jgi:hypothetical protein